MGQKSLSEIMAGRDPHILGENIKALRRSHGWSMRRLSKEAGVHVNTILRIESGLGCTPEIEQRLAVAFDTITEMFAKPIVKLTQHHQPFTQARWLFDNVEECAKYLQRYKLYPEDKRMRMDPEEIQAESERLRLGRLGLATAFIRPTGSVLEHSMRLSCVLELYGRAEGKEPAGTPLHLYCLRGPINVSSNGQEFTLLDGDVLNCTWQESMVFAPTKLIGPHDLPRLLLYVHQKSPVL